MSRGTGPTTPKGREFAEALVQARLSVRKYQLTIGIPVWLAGLGTQDAPRPVPVTEDAAHNVLILYVDAQMEDHVEDGWRAMVQDYLYDGGKRRKNTSVCAIVRTRSRIEIHPDVDKQQPIEQTTIVNGQAVDKPVQDLVAEVDLLLLKQLTGNEVELFICHSRNGVAIAHEMGNLARERYSKVRYFTDRTGIGPGEDVQNALEKRVATSTVVALVTDDFSSRSWCRQELEWARREGRPLVLVDCLQGKTARWCATAAGDAPVIRAKEGENAGLARQSYKSVECLALSESLRFELGSREAERAAQLCSEDDIREHPIRPALVDVMLRLSEADMEAGLHRPLHLHGGPPHNASMRALFDRLGIRVQSAVSSIAESVAGNPLDLRGLCVMVSVSDGADLEKCGVTSEHIDAVLSSLATQLFIHGANFVTGGDFRDLGFVEQLMRVAEQYEPLGSELRRRIRSKLVWPIHTSMPQEDLERRRDIITVVRMDRPEDLLELEDEPMMWAECLSRMRRSVTSECDALIAMAGYRFGCLGYYSGVLEEITWAIASGSTPIFLVGGFGGVVADACAVLTGSSEPTPVFDHWSYSQKYQSSKYAPNVKALAVHGKQRRDEARAQIKRFGLNGLSQRNCLCVEENLRLMTTRNCLEIQVLIATGLSRIKHRRAATTDSTRPKTEISAAL